MLGAAVKAVFVLDAAAPTAPRRRSRATRERLFRLKPASRLKKRASRLKLALADESAAGRPFAARALAVCGVIVRKGVNAFRFEIGRRLTGLSAGARLWLPYRELCADAPGWCPFAGNLIAIDVAGGHASMLRAPFMRSLAAAIGPIAAAAAIPASAPAAT